MVHPIIDKSLPPEALSEEEEIGLIDGETTASQVGLRASADDDFDDDEFAGLSDEPECNEDELNESDDDEGTAPVDLRPIARGDLRRPQQPTIIGGDQRRKPSGRGRSQQNRGKGRPQGSGTKPHGRAGGRKRGRRSKR